jgi:uncharacterized delta-60 repeat protein
MRAKRTLLTIAASALFCTAPHAWGASGDLDPTFGTNGVAVATFGGTFSSANSVVRQADGKLVVAGCAAPAVGQQSAIAVARFDSAGVLDAGFGSGGMVTTDIGPFDDCAKQVMIQSDGKIVVAGGSATVADGSMVEVALVRYESDGTPDATYGAGGIVTTSLGIADDVPEAAALQADDKTIVVGGARTTSATAVDAFVARYDTSGALDGSFGTGGIVSLDFGGRADSPAGILVQPDGYVVVATTSYNGPLFEDGAIASLTRLDSSGALDAGFGTGGSVTESGATVNLFKSVIRQSDGSLVAYGASGPLAVSFRLYRYDSAGVADGGFSGSVSPLFMTPSSSSSVAIGPAGEFAALGDQWAVARVDSGGVLDTTFGSSGYVSLGIGVKGFVVSTLIEPSGDMILAGDTAVIYNPSASTRQMTLARVLGSSAPCIADADCASCERCDTGFCVAGSRSGCTPAPSAGARLKIKNKSYLAKSKLALKWAGTVPSFDPTASDDVGICVFHDGDRIVKAVAPAGGTCGTSPCWTGAAPNFSYSDSERTPDGVRLVKAKANGIKATAAGPELDLSSEGVPETSGLSSFGPPVLLQVQTGAGACVEATFTAGRRVTASSFSGKSD